MFVKGRMGSLENAFLDRFSGCNTDLYVMGIIPM
jgi:hypothetical protein